MKLVIWAELARGGIADYAHDQANALADRGIDVELLCAPSFLNGRECRYTARPILRDLRPADASKSRWLRAANLIHGLLFNARTVAAAVKKAKPDVLLTHFGEYMAPLWAAQFRQIRAEGIRIYTILHDPVRNHVVGPKWWHNRSVAAAYSFIDGVFVHSRESVPVPDGIAVRFVPHGVFSYPKPSRSRAEVRRMLGIGDEVPLLISFGFIRDNKNLDLVIQAMAELPEIELLIAGSEQLGGNRPVSYYRDLAGSLGCQDRCHWLIRFLNDEEVADLICASDLSLLVYSKDFVSSSATLGMTVNYRKPCLISSGSDTTQGIVEETSIGIWVEPDSLAAIRVGLQKWLNGDLNPDWEKYTAENSWERNAEIIHEAIDSER